MQHARLSHVPVVRALPVSVFSHCESCMRRIHGVCICICAHAVFGLASARWGALVFLCYVSLTVGLASVPRGAVALCAHVTDGLPLCVSLIVLVTAARNYLCPVCVWHESRSVSASLLVACGRPPALLLVFAGCLFVSMPSRRNVSASFATTRGQAAASAESRNRLQPTKLPPPLAQRGSEWAGWCPDVFARLSGTNPLSLGGEAAEETLVQLRRSRSSAEDLPVFCRDVCPVALLDAVPHADVWPEVYHRKPEGSVVRALGEVTYTLVYDVPLPLVLRRHSVSVMTHAAQGRSSHRERVRAKRADIERDVSKVIFVSNRCLVTMAFVEWLDRRRRLRLNLRPLNHEILSRYLEALVDKVRVQADAVDILATEHLLHLAPSPYHLRLVSDRCIDCFVPSYFAKHVRMARQIDGAGIRLDAEFKMALRVGQYYKPVKGAKKQKVGRPFHCTLACRGVRGLFLAPFTPFPTYETGDSYVEYLLPILRERRDVCAGDVGDGKPDFISFDNGPAYQLFALAAVGEVWPDAVYGTPQPPCATPALSRKHSSLQLKSVDVVSDPPHRRWHWQKALPSVHPDYRLFDSCLAFALGRICAPLPVIAREYYQSDPHGRGYDEDAEVLKRLAQLSDLKDMKFCVDQASPLARERLCSLLRAHSVREHGFFLRVFGAVPPNKLLHLWGEALGVAPHPDVARDSYREPADFESDIKRIAKWFSHPRLRQATVVVRKPLESASSSAGSRTTGPLLSADHVKEFLGMLAEPLLSSLLRCGVAHRRFRAMGLHPPTGTTIVEQGFSALSAVLFEKNTKWVSPRTFERHAMLAVLFLNFSILRGHEMELLNCKDTRVLAILEVAWERLRGAAGLTVKNSRETAEQLFRDTVARLETAPDTAPVDDDEADPVLPLADSEAESDDS